ncbi:MAG: ATP-binding protein, partial [Helicobacter sp.]|nr:ATP-binding protein [Helicobacter sp.]
PPPRTLTADFNPNNIKLAPAIQNFLERRGFEHHDVQNLETEALNSAAPNLDDFEFIHISHLCFEREQDDRDTHLIDFEQILAAIASKNGQFVYLLESNETGARLYLGTKRDNDKSKFLQASFCGKYLGSSASSLQNLNTLFAPLARSKAMLGIPSLKRDSDKSYKQGLERIVAPMRCMNASRFRILIVAESYEIGTIQAIIDNLRNLGNEIHRLAKMSISMQKSEANTEGVTLTSGSSTSRGETKTEGETETEGNIVGNLMENLKNIKEDFKENININNFEFIKFLKNTSKNITKNKSKSTNHSTSRTNSTTTNESTATSNSSTWTQTQGISREEINKSAAYCETLIDSYIERFQKGLNHGLWNTALYLQAEDDVTLDLLAHTLKSVYSGETSYFESIRFSKNLDKLETFKPQQLPMLYFRGEQHPIHASFSGLCSCINTEELSILAALPRNDIEGLSVGRIASFGLTQKHDKDTIELGNILNKKHPTSQRFTLSLKALNSHLFVSGATGGGKSNTIKHILLALQKIKTPIPFLVIEPAKSEYKNLLDKIPNLFVFRPGTINDTFRFNPFVFEHSHENLANNKGITLTKHIDMLKTTFSSAFPMVGPMPYILEDALYQIYVDKGWNLESEDNPYFTEQEGADHNRKMLLFPNMHDLYAKIESVVEQSGYAGEADSNIKAALKTRIKNLTLGIKGKIFNSRHCISSKILFENPTVIELSAIINDEEKAFLMGLLLNKLAMYREQTHKSNDEQLKHLCVIEEAHRLLPNISLDRSSEEANARGKAVEVFVNILSEIRSLHEGLVIADQVASKLHKDVIKNTNTKIVHRTMDREDRELVGNAINLNESQILDIAELKSGEAIVHSNDVHQAFMVKIDPFEEKDDLPESKFAQANERFLSQNPDYRYEYIDEECFAIAPNGELAKALGKIDTIDKQSLKGAWIQVLCASLFAPNIALQKWHDFRALLEVSAESSREMRKIENGEDQDALAFYMVIHAMKACRFISNMRFYKNIGLHYWFYEHCLWLVDALSNGDMARVENNCAKIYEDLLPKNLKETYPSMRFAPQNCPDCTLLILEIMTSSQRNLDFVNETMSDTSQSATQRADKVLHKFFGITHESLRYALLAIRSGEDAIDLNYLAKKEAK